MSNIIAWVNSVSSRQRLASDSDSSNSSFERVDIDENDDADSIVATSVVPSSSGESTVCDIPDDTLSVATGIEEEDDRMSVFTAVALEEEELDHIEIVNESFSEMRSPEVEIETKEEEKEVSREDDMACSSGDQTASSNVGKRENGLSHTFFLIVMSFLVASAIFGLTSQLMEISRLGKAVENNRIAQKRITAFIVQYQERLTQVNRQIDGLIAQTKENKAATEALQAGRMHPALYNFLVNMYNERLQKLREEKIKTEEAIAKEQKPGEVKEDKNEELKDGPPSSGFKILTVSLDKKGEIKVLKRTPFNLWEKLSLSYQSSDPSTKEKENETPKDDSEQDNILHYPSICIANNFLSKEKECCVYLRFLYFKN